MLNNKHILLGFFAVIMWVIISAISRVMTSDILQTINPIALCFYIFLITSIVFLVSRSSNIKILFQKSKQNIKNIIMLNIVTFGAWFFALYPLKYIEPSVVSSITMGSGPVFTILISHFIYKNASYTKVDYIFSILLILTIIYLSFILFFTETSNYSLGFKQILFAIMSCLVAGFSIATTNIYAKRLSNAAFNPADTLAIRFFLLVLLSAITAKLLGVSLYLSHHDLYRVILISLVLAIIPLYFMQLAVKELMPLTISVIIPIMPALVFFMEYFDLRFKPSLLTISGIGLMSIIVLMASIYKFYSEKKKIFSKNSKVFSQQSNFTESVKEPISLLSK